MAAIQLQALSKTFPDGTEAVRSLELNIADSEFMVFVGPSGCGKTTALRMIAGLEEITGGTIMIGDSVVNKLEPKDRDIAMVFQNYALYPHMTVEDNMAFGLKLRKVRKEEIKRRVFQAAHTLGLGEYLERRPKALSGGQRQRVAMGRAIVREPQVFLMDEPLSNLDAKLRVQMRSEIHKLQRELGVTTIYVTHDQTEAMTMGDRVAVMRRGELQQVDTPQKLYDSPANQFVAGFIGSPSMNIVEAEIFREEATLFVGFGEHRLEIDDSVLGKHPTLQAFVGRKVTLGIRPEDIEDASFVPSTPKTHRLSTTCDLREALGSEVLVHFTVSARALLSEDARELQVDALDLQGASGRPAGSESVFVARLNPRTGVSEGDAIELAIDVRNLHFFDPESELAI
jgi:multiple sugar transport system ATP-binding protein